MIETGPGVTTVKPGDTVARRPSRGIQSSTPSYKWRGQKLNAGWVTTFNQFAVISENRLTVLPSGYDLNVAPLLGYAVTSAAGVINNDAYQLLPSICWGDITLAGGRATTCCTIEHLELYYRDWQVV